MTASLREQFNKIFAQLADDGFLLLSDSDLPSVGGLVTGEKIRGSWWSHKLAQTIFAVSEMLEDHTDVLIMKLISGKVTFVHRELWNPIYSIGVAREEWQLKKLSTKARTLLKALDGAGSIETAKLGNKFGPKPGDTVRELELRMLIYAAQVHTESGKHAKVLETWDAWAKRVAYHPDREDHVAARRFLEGRLARLNQEHSGSGQLPWPSTL
jgi:hypothetical protein